MTDESLLQTQILDELPDDHRPDDEWIAARLRVDHEFKKRMAAGVQRKLKRNFQGGMGTGYTTSDEVWCHYKPTEEQLEKWINEEERGEKRIDEPAATKGDGQDTGTDTADDSGSKSDAAKNGRTTSLSDADEESRRDNSDAVTAAQTDRYTPRSQQETSSTTTGSRNGDAVVGARHANVSAATGGNASNDAPQESWLGMLPALRDGPQQA